MSQMIKLGYVLGCVALLSACAETDSTGNARQSKLGMSSASLEEKKKPDDKLGLQCGEFLAEQEAELHSCCGQPGDVGNELGVGKFCFTDKACKKNKAAIHCSSAENAEADHKSYFCTIPCDPANPVNICGTGAACTCEESGACGCAPTACIDNPPEGCDEV